jgi:tetratricopeptide (TPR) repeat protein
MRPAPGQPFLKAIHAVTACCLVLALAIGAVASADDVQKHFEAGLKLYQSHKTDEALSEFNLALKGAPKDATILRWIGFLELSRQNYDAAREPLERAVELDPKSVVAHLNLGNVYDGLKQHSRALEEFRKVTKLKPDSADAFYDMGLIESKMGHWIDASESLRTAARLDAAAAHGSSGGSEDPAIEDALGYALLSSNDPRGALAAYQKAVTLAPENAEFNYHVGLAWRRLAEEKKAPQETALSNARRALKTAVERAPGNYEYVEHYAEVLFDLNSNAEAAEEFARAAQLDKSQYNPTYNMAIAESRLGRFAAAEKAYARALSLVKPADDPALRRNALNGLTVSLYKQKKYDEAITSLKAFTAEYPSETVGWVNLASAYRLKGDEAAQVEALRSAVANGAGYANLPQLRAALGSLLYRRDDAAGALEQYSLANKAKPDSAEILNGLALTEEKLGRVDDSIRDFQAAVRINPRFADAFNNMGVAYESRYRMTKDKVDLDRALAAYNQALAVDPKHALARKNRERFDKTRKP